AGRMGENPSEITMPESDASPWVDGRTVGDVLRETARSFAARDALVFPALNLRWSWAELDRRVDVVASGLIARGVRPGENVGIWSMNAPEWVVAQFAVARTGAVLVNINPAYRLHELEESLRQVDVATLIVGCPFKSSNFVEMIMTLCPEVATANSAHGWRSEKLPALRRLIAVVNRPGPGWLTVADIETRRVSGAL